jgi:predicted DCC family thiol-disulfide oxidoreductase YuxK
MAEMTNRPVLIYDGQCPFCCRWIERWKSITAGALDFEPYQQAAHRFPQIDPGAFGKAVHLVERDGRISRGAQAVSRALALAGRHRWLRFFYEKVPGFASVAETAYATVAAHRAAADRLDLLLIGPGTQPASYRLTRQLFLRLLGIVYLIAFVSLWVQIDGLIGSRGILPIQTFLHELQSVIGNERYWEFPTLCWFNAGDGFLHFLCAGGVAASLLLVAGVAQLPALAVLFTFYLSLTVAGQNFLSFQWDALLLEAGFLAIFFAPVRPWPRRTRQASEPSRAILWLLRWLLFRVMFMSGVVKLASGDPTWRNLTALRFHYLTQPLPTWTSWYFHQLPASFQTFSCGVVFFAELVIPFLIFAPRRIRLIAFWAIILFQLLIAGTGNYGFFNILTIVLCCTLPDDAFWRWLLRRPPFAPPVVSPPRWRAALTVPLAIVLLAVTVPICVDAFGVPISWPSPILDLENSLSPFRMANGYGLFAIMTTRRPEIIIEGSDDGQTWKPYTFKWKAGELTRRPEFTTPHMPRLDWQMWFAALGDAPNNPWIELFLGRLLEGSPPVLRLLENNPFPDHPPHEVRAVLYDYQFTDFPTRHATGAWWHRDLIGIYCQLSRQPDEPGDPPR